MTQQIPLALKHIRINEQPASLTAIKCAGYFDRQRADIIRDETARISFHMTRMPFNRANLTFAARGRGWATAENGILMYDTPEIRVENLMRAFAEEQIRISSFNRFPPPQIVDKEKTVQRDGYWYPPSIIMTNAIYFQHDCSADIPEEEWGPSFSALECALNDVKRVVMPEASGILDNAGPGLRAYPSMFVAERAPAVQIRNADNTRTMKWADTAVRENIEEPPFDAWTIYMVQPYGTVPLSQTFSAVKTCELLEALEDRFIKPYFENSEDLRRCGNPRLNSFHHSHVDRDKCEKHYEVCTHYAGLN